MTRERTTLTGMTDEQKLEHRRQKAREKSARWRERNPEKHRQQEKARYWADPETARAKNRARLAEHPEYGAHRREYNARWHRENRAKNKTQYRANQLRWRYGLTPEQYDQMLIAQGGHCATCPREPATEKHGSLAVDHDHKTKKIRSLLCSRCNTGIGLAGDSIERLQAWTDYLRRHMAQAQVTPSSGRVAKRPGPFCYQTLNRPECNFGVL